MNEEQLKIEPIRPWPDLFHKENCPLDLSKLAKKALEVLKDCEDNILEKGGGKSSATKRGVDPCHWDESQELMKWLEPRVMEIWEKWGMPICELTAHGWVNWHPKGGWTEEHRHAGTHLAMVVYLKKPENSGNLLVRDPMSYHWAGFPATIERVGPWFPIKVEQGDVVFFPGFIEHKTEVNNSDEDRIVFTINSYKPHIG